MSKQKIKEIYLGGGIFFALSQDNQIFGWGENECGQLGSGFKSNRIIKPQKIVFPSKEKIINISCGLRHTLVLLMNGLLYGWGGNKNGQLGLNKEESVAKPELIEINKNQEKFKYIYCYCNSSFAITTNGLLYSWGYNKEGILGQGNNHNICIPRKVNLFNVQKISSNFLNSYFLTNEGLIYSCDRKQNTPKKISENIFKDLEFNYCYDSEKMFYHLNFDGELETRGKYESITEILARESKQILKMVYIYNESENYDKCKFF